MRRNVEIKARVRDSEAVLRRAAEITAGGPAVLVQEDTFYDVRCGRLKLRVQWEVEGKPPSLRSFGMPLQSAVGMPIQSAFGMRPRSAVGMRPRSASGMPLQSAFGMRPRSVSGKSPRSVSGMSPRSGGTAESARRGELIYYERPDQDGPKTSRYVVVPIDDPSTLHGALAAACGVRGFVRKERTVYLCDRTRIHLDRVEGLGDFLELEVVLGRNEDVAAGEREARDLMARLGVATRDLVRGAYIDHF